MEKKVALYIRVSTDAQYEEGYSVEAQKEKLEQYCKLKDYANYEFFIDGGWSGSNIDRPEMKRMIAAIMSKRISSVIVYKLDRLSRSQKDTVYLLEDVFIPNKCEFVSINENFDTATSYGKAMIGILSVFAQLERENIRERTRMGMYERVKSGKWMGGGRVPFGYDYSPEKDCLIPNEHADEVRQIFELYVKGYSANQIADMFPVANDTHVRGILSRPIYKGLIQFRGELLQGNHEPIVSDELWERAQLVRQRRSVQKTVTSAHLLTGLLYCGCCGAKMRYQKWGNDIKIYCYSQMKSRPNLVRDPNCPNYRFSSKQLEKAVMDSIFEYTDSLEATKEVKVISDSKLKTLQQKYDILSAKIKRLYNLYATDENELLLSTIAENKRELNSLSKLIDAETKAISVIQEISENLAELKNLHTSWDSLDERAKQSALRMCVNKITIERDNISIDFKF